MIRAGSLIGTGTLSANGQNAVNVQNDGAGGGGAGGTIVVFTNSAGLTGLAVNANGGNGGNTWGETAPGTPFPGNRHGPGGGGGGGLTLLSALPAAISVSGGINGYSTTAQDAYGATIGRPGVSVTNLSITQNPGIQSGAYCASTDLSVTNVAAPSVVAPGANITYTQSAINNASFDAVNATFSENPPANTTFQSITPAAGWNCPLPPVNGTLSCTNPDFGAGATANFSVIVQVAAGTPSGTQIVDVDNITSGTSDPNLANNSATAITTVSVATSADLAVTNTYSAPTVTAGSAFTMTALVINQGPSVAAAPTFTEAIPTNATFASLVPVPSGWNCNPLPTVGGGGTITCTASTLAAGSSASFPVQLTATGTTPAGTIISATANASSSTPDSNPSNNSSTASITVATVGQADLSVATTALPNCVSQDNNITYTQSVTNNGPATETNATFTDNIPASTTFFSFTAPPAAAWACSTPVVGAAGVVTCTLSPGQTIAPGASVKFPLVVKANSNATSGTIISNSPTVSSTVGDPNPSNNTATSTTTVASPTQADVGIFKTAAPEPVNQYTNLAYTLQVTNGGSAIARGVTVTDPLPTQVAYASAFSTQGNCTYTASNTTVSCNLGSLTVGSVAVVTINVTANTFSSASLSSNTATVATTTSDPNMANNISTAVSTIQSPTAVDIASFRAFSQSDGSVVLEWRTHEESRNLGFHVYREAASGRQRINPALIAGSALLLRGAKPQHAAKLYRWVDPHPAPRAVYWIEDVDINGTRTFHGPAYVENDLRTSKPALVSASESSPLLRDLRLAPITHKPPLPPIASPHPLNPAPPAGTVPVNVADHAGVKIAVNQEGWYRISFAQLFAAGLDSDTDSRTLHLYVEGLEQRFLLNLHANGILAPEDTIEFYGTGIDTPFSDQRVYWLISDHNPIKHIGTAQSGSAGPSADNSFPFSVIRQDRLLYFPALLNGENNDNFFGAAITSEPTDQTLVVAHGDSSSVLPVLLDVTLQGATFPQDHLVAVELNGDTLGQMEFSGQELATQSFPVPPSLLQDGTNTVTLTALNGDNDVSAVFSLELHYPHTYAADSDWLRATAPSGSELCVTGFTNPNIRVFDLTDPLNINQLNGKVSYAAGSYEISLVLPAFGSAVRTILALADDAISSPISLSYHPPTFLEDRHLGSDVVIISHPDFAASLGPLVRFRETQGHRVALLTTDQIYDEYNFGERSPFAIRSFLQDTLHWTRVPQSVLLVGDASYDPRNYLGLGSFDFVPTRLIETAAFKTASDDWFTDFAQNGFETIPTGRWPVRTAADASMLVSRVMNYESGASNGPWNSQALLVADQNVDANFSSATTAAAGNLPSSLQATTLLTDGVDPATSRAQIISALNNGSLLVDYQGHGAEQQWSFADIFDHTDAAALTNGDRLPVFLLMNCLNGFFQDVYAESLAESILLASNGGGIAVWASSGFTEQPPQATMNQAFLSQLQAHPNDSLGQLILRAKSGTTDPDVRRTWNLFGDPTLKLQFVRPAAPAQNPRPTDGPHVERPKPSSCATVSACSSGRKPL